LACQWDLDQQRGAVDGGAGELEGAAERLDAIACCWVPSCRSRSIRRRVSSPAATTRAREAASAARLSAFAIAVATSSVNEARRASVSAGSGCSRVMPAAIIPHSRPSTMIGDLQAYPRLATT
jgi:hypothetical protein